MKHIFAAAYLLVIALILLLVLSMPHNVRAQVASTTVSVGFNATLTADAEKYVSIPSCSLAAKCSAQLQLCNTNSQGQPDSTHCILIAAVNQSPWNSTLSIGVSQTIASQGTTPYVFGTLRVSVPNNELNIVP